MTIRQVLFSFKGRLNRKPWWITFAVIFPLGLLTDLLLFMFIWTWEGASIALRTSPEGAVFEAPGAEQAGLITSVIGTLIFLWPTLAVWAKRLHDLDLSGWLAVIPYVLWITDLALSYAGLLGSPHQPNPLGSALHTIELLVAIGFIILLGFVRGTRGHNSYGPDPLAASRLPMNPSTIPTVRTSFRANNGNLHANISMGAKP